MRIDGKQIAERMIAELKMSFTPTQYLAAVWVGENAASESFLKQKEKTARELGVEFQLVRFPETITTASLSAEVGVIGKDKKCGGIILQLPLPLAIDRDAVIRGIPLRKDVDSLSGKNEVLPPVVGVVGKILVNEIAQPLFPNRVLPKIFRAVTSSREEAVGGEASSVSEGVASRGSRAASAAGDEERSVLLGLKELHVGVIGRGFLTGAPIAKWLKGKAKALSLVDKGDDFEPLKHADLVISGTGVTGLIRPEMLKPGAICIDFGYGMKDGHVLGDFDPSCDRICSVFTPTPGGTGPILVAQLFTNFYALCEAHGRT